jgi:glycolate oxidase
MQDRGNATFATWHEIIETARTRLDKDIWDYLVGGAESETTLRRNRLGFDSLAFKPRVLRDVSQIKHDARFLDATIKLPVLLAPAGSLDSFHPGGRRAAAEAASSYGAPIVLSNSTFDSETLGDVSGCKIYQLYVWGDDSWLDRHIARAHLAGYRAVCITVDTAAEGHRERDLANGFVKPWSKGRTGIEFGPRFDWDSFSRLRARQPIPLILKGIATAEDALLAADAGADFIYISNHGGRQLDHGRATIDALPEIKAALNGRCKIIVDGGVCRGSDIIKALALGADLVGIGRLYLFGLTANGRSGVTQVLQMLEKEIQTCLALLGVTEIAQLDRRYVCQASPTGSLGLASAFPLLNLDGSD